VGLGQERGAEQGERGGYEKDIRDIVEYFERSCHVRDKLHRYILLQGVLGLPDPDPLVRDPDPSIINQNSKKTLDFYRFVTSS
jgi:hypothetical protein